MTDGGGVPETVSPSTFGYAGNISHGSQNGIKGKSFMATGTVRGDSPPVGTATGDLLSTVGVHNGLSNFLFADGHCKALHGSAVSVGFSNPVVGSCFNTSDNRYAANTQCSDNTIAGTFSVN
jgi:prepilin-type processing-associated H-X9-DG protein